MGHLRGLEKLIDDARIQQMLALRAPRITVHQLLHQVRANHTRILANLHCDLERLGQHTLRRIDRVRKQAVPDVVASEVGGAGGDGVHGARVADQPGQEEGRTGLHDEAAAGEDEADFGVLIGDADVHGERHGDADADGGALEGADCGFAAVVDCEGDAAAAVITSAFCSATSL